MEGASSRMDGSGCFRRAAPLTQPDGKGGSGGGVDVFKKGQLSRDRSLTGGAGAGVDGTAVSRTANRSARHRRADLCRIARSEARTAEYVGDRRRRDLLARAEPPATNDQ